MTTDMKVIDAVNYIPLVFQVDTHDMNLGCLSVKKRSIMLKENTSSCGPQPLRMSQLDLPQRNHL